MKPYGILEAFTYYKEMATKRQTRRKLKRIKLRAERRKSKGDKQCV